MESCYHCKKHKNCPFRFYKDANTCLGFVPIKNLTKEEFKKSYCQYCNFQESPFVFCEGIGSEWFNGCCKYKNCLKDS